MSHFSKNNSAIPLVLCPSQVGWADPVFTPHFIIVNMQQNTKHNESHHKHLFSATFNNKCFKVENSIILYAVTDDITW